MEPWKIFFNEKVQKIFSERKRIIDIGGGLRIDLKRGNRFDADHKWILPLAKKVDYKIMDVVSDYNPDIVGDILNIPFISNEIDAIFCLSVLQHVDKPWRAVEEIYRVLKPGGQGLIYVPFLYYYHGLPGYYKDYWRFTHDCIEVLFKDFSKLEICKVRGAIGTLIRLTPLGRWSLMEKMAYYFDKITGKLQSNQTSGYYIYLEK